jgi:SAM-dependent methyltransferase
MALNNLDQLFSMGRPLTLPDGLSESTLFDFVTSVCVQNAPIQEMKNYGTQDFRRFIYTLGLASGIKGKCLELGSNPYFTTMLLSEFTDLEIISANYFSYEKNGEYIEKVDYNDIHDGTSKTKEFKFNHFNVENDQFPYQDGEFDLVIFSEIIEHLLNDPCKTIREIKRVLKPGGTMILTTPNVARLENVAKLMSGANIYDPYSGYGPYGRHNREYNRHELVELLKFEGYELEDHFTADVHHNNSQNFFDIEKIADFIKFREGDLGQYIFVKAISSDRGSPQKRPSWLYRSYPESELI